MGSKCGSIEWRIPTHRDIVHCQRPVQDIDDKHYHDSGQRAPAQDPIEGLFQNRVYYLMDCEIEPIKKYEGNCQPYRGHEYSRKLPKSLGDSICITPGGFENFNGRQRPGVTYCMRLTTFPRSALDSSFLSSFEAVACFPEISRRFSALWCSEQKS